MARSPAKAATPETPKILPIPVTVLRHHSASLFGPMKQWRESKKVPPVLLLTGQAGSGKREIAYFLAQWLLCERSGLTEEPSMGLFGGGTEPAFDPAADPLPCGECASCLRALHGTWVDFKEIAAENEDGSPGTLKIEQFRDLKATLGFGSFGGSYRITLIRDADRMTVQAANSLLKLLEEPPPGWVLFLTASDASLLLPTLVSRCQKLRLLPFTKPSILELLQLAGAPADRHGVSAELSQGSWSRALRIAEDDTWEARKSILRFIDEPAAEVGGLVDWGASEPSHFNLLLDQLEQALSDLIRWSLNPSGTDLSVIDGRKVLASHAAALTRRLGSVEAAREFWFARSERLFRARQESLAPLNRKLLIQDLLLPWLEL